MSPPRTPAEVSPPRIPATVPPARSTPLTMGLGLSALVTLGLTTWWGLWVSPPDVTQGQFVRMLYVHPAVAMTTFVAFGCVPLPASPTSGPAPAAPDGTSWQAPLPR